MVNLVERLNQILMVVRSIEGFRFEDLIVDHEVYHGHPVARYIILRIYTATASFTGMPCRLLMMFQKRPIQLLELIGQLRIEKRYDLVKVKELGSKEALE